MMTRRNTSSKKTVPKVLELRTTLICIPASTLVSRSKNSSVVYNFLDKIKILFQLKIKFIVNKARK